MALWEGFLPAKWVRARIADIGAVRLGRQHSPDKQSDRFATRYLRGKNITPSGLNLIHFLEMDFTAAERATFTPVDRDPVITEASGSGGRAAFGKAKFLAAASKTPLSDCDRTQSPRGRDCRRSGTWLTQLNSKELRGVGIQHLGSYRFAEVVIGLPPLAVQF
jgi:hypothetical protein